MVSPPRTPLDLRSPRAPRQLADWVAQYVQHHASNVSKRDMQFVAASVRLRPVKATIGDPRALAAPQHALDGESRTL